MEANGGAIVGDPRDVLIGQLEHALETRIVIEQAKGIISERFGLSIGDSFQLFRQAARSHQLKAHALAAELVADRSTPTAIIDALIKVGHPKAEGFAARAMHAEQLFADMNDALMAVHRETQWSKFICECTNPLCTETIILSAELLAKVHEHPGHYVIKTGHEVTAVETVIDRIDGLVIVDKSHGPTPRRPAGASETRSDSM